MNTRDKRLALGIDIGTTNVKAAMLEPGAPPHVLARASAPHPTRRPAPGWSEQDPGGWWDALLDSLAALGPDLSKVAAVSVSGQGSTFCLCDDAARPLAPAIGWQDLRASADAAGVEAHLGGELARAHGNAVGDAPEPKLLWLLRERPELVDRTQTVLTAAATVSASLGGRPALNEGDAGSWLSWNRHEARWDDRISSALGLARFLPDVARLGSRVGEVSAESGIATGITAGTPLVASTTDVAAAAFAAGACGVGDVFYSKGTGGFVCVTVNPVRDPSPLLGLPVGNGTVQLCAASNSVGASYDWARAIMGVGHGEAERLAAVASPGAAGLVILPWLQGAQHPFIAPEARGVAFGLSLETSRGDVLRGILEGTALDLRRNLEVSRRVAGVELGVVVSSGGPTRCNLWNRLDAAAAGVPLVISPETDAAVGSALVAGEAVGLWPSALEAGTEMRGDGIRFDPEPQLLEAARVAAAVADDLAERVLPLFSSLAALRNVQR